MPRMKDNTTTTALYNLRKKQELSKKTGSSKKRADEQARQAPISAMKRRSAQIKADIKKRTEATKAKASKPDISKAQRAAYIPTNKKSTKSSRSPKQRAFLAIKYKKK